MSRSKKRNNGKKPYVNESSRGQRSDKKTAETTGPKESDGGVAEKEAEREAEREAANKDPNVRQAMNDPAWYMQYPELAVDSASIPYSDPLGSTLKLSEEDGFNYGTDADARIITSSRQADERTFPGILTLYVKHTLGHSVNKTDAVNVAANALYTNVRFVNSGRKNYDPADLFMYCATMAEIYSFIGWCRRIYGKCFVYSQVNKYIGEALLKSDNVNPQDLLYNLANFRMWLNTFINKVSSYAVPAGIPYFERRIFMYSSVYTESDTGNIKDQLYQFNPIGFYSFDLDERGAGCLKQKLLGWRNESTGLIQSTALSAQQIMQYGNNLLSTISGDEDFGLISGDILKAYDGNIITLSVVDPEYAVVPVFDLDVLRQFRNANLVGTHISVGDDLASQFTVTHGDNTYYYPCGNIYQDPSTGNIQCWDTVEDMNWEDVVFNRMNRMIDVNSPIPTVADNLESSRLMSYANWYKLYQGTTEVDRLVLFSGTEIAVCAMITYNKVSPSSIGSSSVVEVVKPLIAAGSTDNINVIPERTNVMMLVAHFHYAPFVYVVVADFNTNSVDVHEVYPIENVDNFVFITKNTLQKMHDCALLSMFFAPGVAKVVSVTR